MGVIQCALGWLRLVRFVRLETLSPWKPIMTQTLALIDYGAGNVRSMANALGEAARRAGLSVDVVLTHDPDEITQADRVVLPGVGAFGACRAGIDAVDGLYEALDGFVHDQAKPFLGVCVGMQLLATRGLEHGTHAGFDWIAGDVARLAPNVPGLNIPHMGWNRVTRADAVGTDTLGLGTLGPAASEQNAASAQKRDDVFSPEPAHPVLGALDEGAYVYFVHSFAFSVADPSDAVLMCDYGGPFVAAVARETIVGTQFHPEKSQAAGLNLLSAFLKWAP